VTSSGSLGYPSPREYRAWFILLLFAPPLWGIGFLLGLTLVLAWVTAPRTLW